MKQDARLRILLLSICLCATLCTAGWLASRTDAVLEPPSGTAASRDVSVYAAPEWEGETQGLSSGQTSALRPAVKPEGGSTASAHDSDAVSSVESGSGHPPAFSAGAILSGGVSSAPPDKGSASRPAVSSKPRPPPSSAPPKPESSSRPDSSQASSPPPANSSETEPPVSPSQPEPTPPPPDPDALKRQNDRTASMLTHGTGVTVVIVRQWGSDWDGFLDSPAGDENEVYAALSLLKIALFPYFNNLLAGQGASVILAGELNDSAESLLFGENALFSCAISLYEAQETMFGLACSFLPTAPSDGLEALLPPDFRYGDQNPRYVFSSSAPASQVCFLSLAAQESPEADFRSILRGFIEAPQKLLEIPPQAPLFRKAGLSCEVFSGAFPGISDDLTILYFIGN